MSDTFTLEIKGLAELIARLEALGRDVEAEMEPVVTRALDYLWQELPPYPPKPHPGVASRYWTPRQRAWFFAALRAGQVETPYKRRLSAGLGGSFATEVRSQAGALIGLMGPSVPYAQYVIGAGKQAPLHAGRWWIFEEEVQKNLPNAIAIIEEGVQQLIRNF
ncbi:MAG: hypothetical protein ACP5J4_11075 [Anaerolineae bacterium]